MSWLILVLINAFLLAISNILQKKLMKENNSNPTLYSAIFQFSVSILMFLTSIILTGFKLPKNIIVLLPNIILSTILYTFAVLFLFKSLKKLPSSEVTLINTSRIIWSSLTATLFLKEHLSLKIIFGTIFIISGIFLPFFKKKYLKFDKNFWFAILSALLFGTAFTNDAFLLKFFDPLSFASISFFFPSILLFLIKPTQIFKIKEIISLKKFTNIVIMSLIYGFATISIYYAYKKGGLVSQIYPISQLATLFTIFLAYFFLNEKKDIKKKIIAFFITIIGIIFISN